MVRSLAVCGALWCTVLRTLRTEWVKLFLFKTGVALQHGGGPARRPTGHHGRAQQLHGAGSPCSGHVEAPAMRLVHHRAAGGDPKGVLPPQLKTTLIHHSTPHPTTQSYTDEPRITLTQIHTDARLH